MEALCWRNRNSNLIIAQRKRRAADGCVELNNRDEMRDIGRERCLPFRNRLKVISRLSNFCDRRYCGPNVNTQMLLCFQIRNTKHEEQRQTRILIDRALSDREQWSTMVSINQINSVIKLEYRTARETIHSQHRTIAF